MALRLNPSIFRQYDIRGVWGKDLNEEIARLIGKGFAAYLLKSIDKESARISVGMDGRLHSRAIHDGLIRGLTESGLDVIDLGICPTPLQYYSLYKLSLDGGIMITGSHNPPEFNGFKLSVGRETIFGDAIKEIKRIIASGDFVIGNGGVELYPSIINDYVDFMRKAFIDLSGLKVVVDAGNGVGGLVAPKLMKALGVEVSELYCEPDGRFPNHHPDPVVEKNLADLIEKVKEMRANAGIAYDGDADRIGVVDENGEIIWGDRLTIIFARDIMKNARSEVMTFIGEVKCSQVMYDEIERLGGRVMMWKTGHSQIKDKLKKEKAVLAGEMSGHIFFADRYFGYDDAIYASLRLLEILKKNGMPYSINRLIEDIPKTVSTPEIRIDCPDDSKFEAVEKVKEAFKGYPMITIDGIRIRFDDGWALLRASNTEPVLVLRFEAKDKGRLMEIMAHVESELKKVLNQKMKGLLNTDNAEC